MAHADGGKVGFLGLAEAERLGALPSVAASAGAAYAEADAGGRWEDDFAPVIEPIATKFGLK